jgi:hypothetical protein
MGRSSIRAISSRERRAKESEHLKANVDEKEDEFEENDELPPPDPMREGIDWVRDDRGHISHPIQKRAHDALHASLEELKAAGHFPEDRDEQLADFVSGFMTSVQSSPVLWVGLRAAPIFLKQPC